LLQARSFPSVRYNAEETRHVAPPASSLFAAPNTDVIDLTPAPSESLLLS